MGIWWRLIWPPLPDMPRGMGTADDRRAIENLSPILNGGSYRAMFAAHDLRELKHVHPPHYNRFDFRARGPFSLRT
ncbi:hypothetical protein [Rhizobium sp. AN80A]|uniref:hypothetical protein n=1 Tax=Rhizobium sp. AN80A TaxID=3040673 RepID=UPI0024B3A92F|nr:hypothetical protein [Rhizobium sp. AN80A]